jgi:hypothetical protein
MAKWPGLQGGGSGIAGREEQLGEHQHGGRGVDVEIEELDGGADQAGKQDGGRRIGLGLTHAGRSC